VKIYFSDYLLESYNTQVTDESGTYIIEPVSGEEYYSEDPNIMWIQETVEVEQESYDNLPNMVRTPEGKGYFGN
jgi:hypothetical protein